MEKSNALVSTPIAIVIGSVLISVSILISGGAIKIKGFNAGTTAQAPTAPIAPTAPTAPEEPTGPVKVSLDDDPVLGNSNAPVTLVEFSDYECPFCKRHYDQTHSQLVKDYIDTGKVKLVFRDLPLSFHDPMATTEAIAANCAKDQGGDAAYYKMHDVMFEKTTSNGSGLTKDQLNTFAGEQGLNVANFKACVDSEKFKEEVSKDLADAGAAGATGTPSFIIGKSTGQEIEGKLIVGAQPYSAFKSEIDALLQ
ncbi:MAG TPA: thioredoxin domain-containing protein [Patescibacteria group bacterium]|nr:thioredoxin domain-containing protein [Patescibacteria group bacterium]